MEHTDEHLTSVRPGAAPGSPSGAPGPAAAPDASPEAPSGAPSSAPTPPPAPGLRATLRRDLRIGVKADLQTFWELARVMIPAYGATLVLERLGVIQWLAQLARPLMALLGLPGHAAGLRLVSV